MLAGFNVIRRIFEKLCVSVALSMRDFDGFIRESELIDPPLRNASFACLNIQEILICEKLDRFFIYKLVGDCLIVLDTNPFKWDSTPLRFENMWLVHPNFRKRFDCGWRE